MKATTEELVAAVKSAEWFINHVMGDKKRVDWGNTFDMDWAGVNDALLKISLAAKKL